VKDFDALKQKSFAGGECDGYFGSVGRRFESCQGIAEKRLHVAQMVEQPRAKAGSVSGDSPAKLFWKVEITEFAGGEGDGYFYGGSQVQILPWVRWRAGP
jgi:hypothetical protein